MDILKSLWRMYHGHVMVIAFLIGLFAAVMVGLQQTLENAEGSVKRALSAVAFLQNNLSEMEAIALMQSMKEQDPEIQSIDYTSKEQAYQEAMKDPKLAKSLLLLKTNPLPASLTIRYSDKAWWERPDPTERLRSLDTLQEIRWDPQARTLFQTLHRWQLGALRFAAFLGVVLLGWAFMGLYRFLSLQSTFGEIAGYLGTGVFGGALAWGLWEIGVRSVQADVSTVHPVWVRVVPMVIGAVSAVGCFGLGIRR